eukprot:CAMPEP_0176499662 /NCGR_PEP_ID=MMETSP0200_2-20121128/13059_1 /TAXON_ID=947934 /ORGANISM="Chaetoceros sp., Strain GSL56" /LENGTH=927 /DNA_ID=CAMNT_0017898121 /DNA_START=89 /DNA_END=2872 /DNA_ORIENTATION=-
MSSRIDWRHYDYSEGPPKRQRDTNPYAKATDFRSRTLASSSHLDISNSVTVPALVVSSTATHKSNDDPLSSIEKPISKRSPRRTEANTSSNSNSKLFYRSPLPPFEDEAEPSIPEIRRQLTVHCDENEEPFDANVNVHTSSANPSPQPVTPTREDALEHLTNATFEKVWQDADKYLEEEKDTRDKFTNYVSDDGDDEEPKVNANRDNFDRDMIAKDRVQGRSQSPSKSSSEASVAQLDIDRNFEPVSILRSNGRYAEHDKERQDHSRSRSVASRASSSSRRKHPWDQDFVEEDEPSVENIEGATHESVPGLDGLEKKYNNTVLDNQDAAKEQEQLYLLSVKDQQAISVSSMKHGVVNDKYVNNNHILLNDNIAERRKGRRKKSRRSDNIREEDDDTSIEESEGNSNRADTLRDRTKQAWSMRNQANLVGGRSRSTEIGRQATDNDSQYDKPRQSLVSFQQDTVHEFVPEEESGSGSDSATEVTDYTERTGDYTYDDEDTFAGRSMHSMYTKSNESEAEDLFKDLFFIGSGKATNPGRRQIRYKKEFKEEFKAKSRSKAAQMSDEEDEATLEEQSTIDGSLTSPDVNVDRKKSSNMDDDESISKTDTKSGGTFYEMENDPFTITYNYCEDLVKAIASACGLSSKDEHNASTETNDCDTVEKQEKHSVSDETSIVDSFVDYATNAMFPHHKTAFSKEENKKALTELAINAAITKHTIQNVKYDEMHDLCLNREIKIVKTVIGLPIGIIFSESYTCCWVKRIFETGNATVAFAGDKIEVGDQLAAVNELSVMFKNVAEVCRLLASASNPEAIQLTFVRYVGPLRVATNEQQGYEVIDTKLNKSGKFSPSSLVRKISFSRPRSPNNTGDSPPVSQEITQDSVQKPKHVATSSKSSSLDTKMSKTNEVQTEKKKEKKKRFSFFRRKAKKQNK